MKVSNTIGFSLIETLKSSVLYRDDALTESFTCPTDKKLSHIDILNLSNNLSNETESG